MNCIKQIIFVLYTAAYTSLIWACACFEGVTVDMSNGEDFELGAFILTFWTIINLVVVGVWIADHWGDEE